MKEKDKEKEKKRKKAKLEKEKANYFAFYDDVKHYSKGKEQW